MSNNWRVDSDMSSDELNTNPAAKKRSSRACDQCRKSKSKCERPESGRCKGCVLADTACTFLGPSYKRGPPKGYIHAIEQRWHQVESLLGAIIACPDVRAQNIISELKKDDLAREILLRVDAGPFGPSGRLNQPEGASKEDFFASIIQGDEVSPVRETARSRRQSRVSREIVSSNRDNSLSVIPTMEWQDRLSNHLASPSVSYDNVPSTSPMSSENSGTPLAQRRRLESHMSDDDAQQPNWNTMYTMDTSDTDDHNTSADPVEGFGQLSLDENHEVRFHGQASGLHLLGRNDRTDDGHWGGIWPLPMARVRPPAVNLTSHLVQEKDVDAQLPPIEVQDRLVELYFAHIHPVFPIVHKSHFIAEYRASRSLSRDSNMDSSPTPPRPEPSQIISKLLLFSMFSIAARYCDCDESPPPQGQMWDAGCGFLNDARKVLTRVFHRSSTSSCQALLLLGHREFGIGSMGQGWIYIGMAVRMAFDLGLNQNADKWQINGRDLFSSEEKEVRKQIWWGCCIADKYSSVYMGRPISIREDDFDTPLPENEDTETWQPLSSDSIKINYPSVPGRITSCFRAAGSLSVIVGNIMTLMYPVQPTSLTSRRATLVALETSLDQWYIELPEYLRYDASSKWIIPPPHILLLNIRYWGAVLLLHRAFIPNWKGIEPIFRLQRTESDSISLKAFDLCQGAASHISTIVTAYLEHFSLKRCSPLLSSYILSAGIMHVVTLKLRPASLQPSLGLRQSLRALKEMEVIWPSASRAWSLLNDVKVRFDNAWMAPEPGPDRHKRHADDVFEREKSSKVLPRDASDITEQALPATNAHGVQDLSACMMTMLGLDLPGMDARGSEWWTSSGVHHGMEPSPSQLPSLDTSTPGSSSSYTADPVSLEDQNDMDEWFDSTRSYAFD